MMMKGWVFLSFFIFLFVIFIYVSFLLRDFLLRLGLYHNYRYGIFHFLFYIFLPPFVLFLFVFFSLFRMTMDSRINVTNGIPSFYFLFILYSASLHGHLLHILYLT